MSLVFDYVIVGAGPTGLAAAVALVNAGKRVGVFEMRPRPTKFPGKYPVVLNARGMRSLSALDPVLAKRAMMLGRPVEVVNHIVQASNSDTTPRPRCISGTCIMLDHVQQILLEHAEGVNHRNEAPDLRKDGEITESDDEAGSKVKVGNIEFFWGYRLVDIDFQEHELLFLTDDGGEMGVHAPRLLAADGNRSEVRHICERQFPGFSCKSDPWGFTIRYMATPPPASETDISTSTVHQVMRDCSGYVCQQPNGAWNASFVIMPEDDGDFLTAEEGEEPTVERFAALRQYTKESCGSIVAGQLLKGENGDDVCRGFYSGMRFSGSLVKCSCLNPAEWILLLGDAGHACLPCYPTGEGINAALEDSAVFAQCLNDCQQTGREDGVNPITAFNEARLADAHALYTISCWDRELIVGLTPRALVVHRITIFFLRLARALGVIEGHRWDFQSGVKSAEGGAGGGPKSYAELVEMHKRQSKWPGRFARGLCKFCVFPSGNEAGLLRMSSSTMPYITFKWLLLGVVAVLISTVVRGY